MFTEKYSAERIYPVHKIALRQMNMYNHLTEHKNYMYMSIALRLLFLSIVALTKEFFFNAKDMAVNDLYMAWYIMKNLHVYFKTMGLKGQGFTTK